LTGIPRLGLGAVSIGYIALFLGVAIPRVQYPFGLEWLEGQALVSVQRILEGQPLFTAPSWEYIPFMYTPLYYYVSAAWVGVMDLGLPALRVVSLVATLVCFVLSFAIARRASGDSSTGLIAAGLFAATFEASGAWFDLARVDMLFLALLLSGLYAVQRNGRFSLALAAPLLAAAYLTKQTALVMVLPILLYAVLVRPRAGLLLAGALAAIVLATTLVWDRASDGWYWRFTLELPRQTYTLAPAQALGFWTHDLLGSVPIALLAIAFHLGTRWRSVWSERCRSGRRLVDELPQRAPSRRRRFVTPAALRHAPRDGPDRRSVGVASARGRIRERADPGLLRHRDRGLRCTARDPRFRLGHAWADRRSSPGIRSVRDLGIRPARPGAQPCQRPERARARREAGVVPGRCLHAVPPGSGPAGGKTYVCPGGRLELADLE
jgi:hypothetical protein